MSLIDEKTMCVLLLALLSGCISIRTTSELRRAESLARVSSYVGAALYLERNPEDLKYFVAARNALTTALATNEVDPSAIRESLAIIPIGELRSDRSAIILTSAVLLLEEINISMPIESSGMARAVGIGARDGLDLAIMLRQQTATHQ